LLLELEERRANRLAELDEMLRRLDEGSYGICDKCGERIPFARLRAIPSARYCVACQEQEEWNAPPPRANDAGGWPVRWAM
jgi:DnaK suppressor protein